MMLDCASGREEKDSRIEETLEGTGFQAVQELRHGSLLIRRSWELEGLLLKVGSVRVDQNTYHVAETSSREDYLLTCTLWVCDLQIVQSVV